MDNVFGGVMSTMNKISNILEFSMIPFLYEIYIRRGNSQQVQFNPVRNVVLIIGPIVTNLGGGRLVSCAKGLILPWSRAMAVFLK